MNIVCVKIVIKKNRENRPTVIAVLCSLYHRESVRGLTVNSLTECDPCLRVWCVASSVGSFCVHHTKECVSETGLATGRVCE